MRTLVSAERYHDISCGHRVHGHESKCALLHGHNYRVIFTIQGEQDALGRVLDFSIIKETLCAWLERNWDHHFLAWKDDPILQDLSMYLHRAGDSLQALGVRTTVLGSIVWVPFNPTAENMGLYLLEEIGPQLLEPSGCELVRVRVEETRKCSAEVFRSA